MSTPITVREITDDPLVNRVQDVAAQAAANTTVFQKRRNSFAGFANMLLQFINGAAFLLTDIPLWLTVAIAAVVFVAEIIVHATSKTPVTQAVVDKVTDEARQQSAQHTLADVGAPPTPTFSVYH